MVTVVYMRGGPKYRALTGKILMFWIGVPLIERFKTHARQTASVRYKWTISQNRK